MNSLHTPTDRLSFQETLPKQLSRFASRASTTTATRTPAESSVHTTTTNHKSVALQSTTTSVADYPDSVESSRMRRVCSVEVASTGNDDMHETPNAEASVACSTTPASAPTTRRSAGCQEVLVVTRLRSVVRVVQDGVARDEGVEQTKTVWRTAPYTIRPAPLTSLV